jgi:hypothetical protein
MKIEFDPNLSMKDTDVMKVLFFWNQFKKNKTTEFWDKDTFEKILKYEDYIVKLIIEVYDEKPILILNSSKAQVDYHKNLIEIIRQTYQNRFGEKEPEDHTKFNNPEKFYLLEKMGFTDLPKYKNLSETDKAKVLEKILGCSFDTAKKIKNNDPSYVIKDHKADKIDKFLSKIAKEI